MRPLRVLTAAAAAATTLAAAPPALAHNAGSCGRWQAPRIELGCARAEAWHAQTTIRWARHQRRPLASPAVRDVVREMKLAGMIRNHSWLLARMRVAETEARTRIVVSSRPPHYRQWICIHGGEGSWLDDGAPYWGGLQMNVSFERTYAAAYAATYHQPDPYLTLGSANNWTPLVQMWVAEMAYESRGFWPWPSTARRCGLL